MIKGDRLIRKVLDRSSPGDPRQEQMSRGKLAIVPEKLFFSWQVYWFGMLAKKKNKRQKKKPEEDTDVRVSGGVPQTNLHLWWPTSREAPTWVSYPLSLCQVKWFCGKNRNFKMRGKIAEYNGRVPVALLGDRWRNWFEKKSICNHLHYYIVTFTWTFQMWSLKHIIGGRWR